MDIPRILLVDDEPCILKALQRSLRREQMEVTATTSPEEALCFLKAESFALIISDYRMPTMDGVHLLKEAQKISPETVRVILTGYTDARVLDEATEEGKVYRFLTKPWNEGELRDVIRGAVCRFEEEAGPGLLSFSFRPEKNSEPGPVLSR